MDFSQFDQRGRDEAGTPHPILHPDTGEPIIDTDGKPCLVLVRGPTAPSVVAAENARNKAGLFTVEDAKGMTIGEMHDRAVAVALPFIAGFENVLKADGSPFTEADAPYFLSMNMPVIKFEDGAVSMENKPFAEQILEIVNAKKATLGNVPAP